MDIVSQIEAVGSQAGKPAKVVTIIDSGELEMGADVQDEL